MRCVVSLLMIGLLWLVGCGENQSEVEDQSNISGQHTLAPRITPTFSGPVTLTLWHPYQGPSADALQTAAEVFTVANPNLKVVFEYHTPEELRADYEHAVQQGAGPEILVTQPQWVGDLVKNRLILPLDTSLIDYLGTQLDAQVFQSLDYEDQYWGSPLSADVLMLYTKIADITFEPRAIDDLLVVAGENGIVLPVDTVSLLGLYQSPTSAFFNSAGKPMIDQSALISFTTLLHSLATDGRVTFSDDPDSFINGSASALVAPASLYPTLAAALGDQLRVSRLPEITAGVLWRPVVELTLLTVSVNATDESLRAASLLLAYLISPETQERLATEAEFMPIMNVTTSTNSTTRLYIQQLRNSQPMTLDPSFYQDFLPDFEGLLSQVRQPDVDVVTLVETWLAEHSGQ